MTKIKYKDHLDTLIAVAEGQEGYFSAAQATEAGIDHVTLVRLARAGHLEREHWGIYRLARWPIATHPDLWPVYLWAKAKGRVALSHRTALQLHGISDINPSKIDVTFDVAVRRIRGEVPPATVLHSRPLEQRDIEYVDGLPVTTVYRTLLDLLVDNLARDAVSEVLSQRPTWQRYLLAEQAARLLKLYDLDPEIRAYLDRVRAQRNALVHDLTLPTGKAR